MGIKKYKPTSAARRLTTVSDFADITRDRPEKSLTEAMKRSGGRNSTGAITSWWRGHFGLEWQRAARRTAKEAIARLAAWCGDLERGARGIGKTIVVRAARGLAAAFDLWRALKLASGGLVISLRRRIDRWRRR